MQYCVFLLVILFNLIYIQLSSSSPPLPPPCIFEYNSSQIDYGEVYSPNYPGTYPNNLNCRYEFHANENERVILEFIDFELEQPQNNAFQENSFLDFVMTNTRNTSLANTKASKIETVTDLTRQCFYDFLDVFFTDGQGRLFWRSRHCGSNIDSQIVSNSPTLILIFQTDRMLSFRGFKLKFHFSYLSILPFHSRQSICGPSEIIGNGSVLSSPSYPFSASDHIECAWTITVNKHERILFKFVDINLDPPCHRSHVKFWDGYVGDVSRPDKMVCEKLAYYKRGVMMFKSKTNRMVIKYTSKIEGTVNDDDFYKFEDLDENASNLDNLTSVEKRKGVSKIKRGFQFIWTAVTLNDDCDQFQCEGGDFCIDENKMLCQPTNRYCISKSLVCDGVLNCDLGDHSDEKQCELNYIKSQKFILILGTCTLVCLFLIFICITLQKIKSRRRKLTFSNEYAFKEQALNEPDFSNLKIEKKLNKLSSFTLQSSTFIEDEFNEDFKEIKQPKTNGKQKKSKSDSSSSSSSSLSLINKNASDHYQIETVIPEKNFVKISSYQPFVNVKTNLDKNKASYLKNDNGSILFKDLSKAKNKKDHLVPPLSPVDSNDKKSSTSNTYACSQLTSENSMQSQMKQDEFYNTDENSKNSRFFEEDGLSSLRRNSYTKAIFFDNL